MNHRDHSVADYVIAGAGCAGLSLALALKRSTLSFTRVVLIDKTPKVNNDRTWCFWTSEEDHWYDEIVCQRWDRIGFGGVDFKTTYPIAPYTYKLIRGLDFYNYCIQELKQDARFEFIYDEIVSLQSTAECALAKTHTHSVSCAYIFNSAIRTLDKKQGHVNYVQHFKGWVVETEEAVFADDRPLFMDFQKTGRSGCYFYYVIPYSRRRALVEYTGFSKEPLAEEAYDAALKTYMDDVAGRIPYRIVETESGQIPMNESVFINPFGKHVINIGSAGGNSKQSTGYTFYYIQQHTRQMLEALLCGTVPTAFERKPRFAFYDKVFMNVLDNGDMPASHVFSDLMKKNNIRDILAFLNEESTAYQEMKIMLSVRKWPFLKAFFGQLVKRS